MTELDLEINLRLMEEMGLEEGDRRRVIDQDTGLLYQMKGKDLVTPGSQSGKAATEFDPINNTRMMSYMFGTFLEKLEDEESIPGVRNYHMDPPNSQGKIRGTINFDDGSSISSGLYRNETTCYADLVLRLNNEENVNLDKYDIDRTKSKPGVVAPKKTTKKASKPKTKKKEA